MVGLLAGRGALLGLQGCADPPRQLVVGIVGGPVVRGDLGRRGPRAIGELTGQGRVDGGGLTGHETTADALGDQRVGERDVPAGGVEEVSVRQVAQCVGDLDIPESGHGGQHGDGQWPTGEAERPDDGPRHVVEATQPRVQQVVEHGREGGPAAGDRELLR